MFGQPTMLAVLVSLPAFVSGHLWRNGEFASALQVSMLSAAVVLLAAAIAGGSQSRVR